MKSALFILTILSLGFVACEKDSDNNYFPNGIYKGSFKRYNVAGSQEAQVTISFDYPNWSGSSNISRYPALGKGTFYSDNEVLKFKSTSVWTADFDWTLILDGAYIENRKGDSLIFTRSYGDGAVDMYKLKKQ
jgi:hypothetical protein